MNHNLKTNPNAVKELLEFNALTIKACLPSHVKMETFVQTAITASLVNPRLNECSPQSLLIALTECASDGLLPNGKEAFINAYKAKGVMTAQYQTMVDGLIKIIMQSGKISTMFAETVYKDDVFEYGVNIDGQHLKFIPNLFSENRSKENIKCFFAMAKNTSGDTVVEIMTLSDVNKVMINSKGAVDSNGNIRPTSPWNNWFERMGCKSVIHRIGRRLPKSSKAMELIERDIQIKPFIKQSNHIEPPEQVETIGEEFITELRQLATFTGSDTAKMFGWVSSKTGRVANSFEELTQQQFLILKEQLEIKQAEKIKTESSLNLDHQLAS